MADKLTLIELHLHAEDNEFTSDMQLSSDIGGLLRRRFGLGSESDEETEDADFGEEIKAEVDERTPIGATADGGDTVQIDEADEDEESGAVVEIDADADIGEDEAEEEKSGGRSKGKSLFVLMVLVSFALLAKRYLDADDLEDEFEEL